MNLTSPIAALRADIAEAVLSHGESDQKDFATYCRRRTLALLRLGMWAATLANILWLPTDFFVFGDDPRVLHGVIVFRLTYIVGSPAWYQLVLRRRDRIGMTSVVVTYLFFATLSFGAIGLIDSIRTESMLSAAFIVPFFTTIFLIPLRRRIVLNVVACALTGTAYYVCSRGASAHSAYTWAFFPFTPFCAVLLGHFLYELNRTAFDQRQEILRYARSLEEANRMKDAFVATVSHELRTPLNAILGMTEALQEESLEFPAQRYLDTLRHSGELLLSLIDDLLTLARLKADKVTLEAIPYSLPGVVEKSVALVAVNARAKGLTIATSVPADLPTLQGDPTRMGQVLLNLLGNAIKFTERGEIRVSVKRDQARLTLSVADTGLGIPAEKRALIFEEFTQVDVSTTRRFGGTGLGLTIVRRLVTLMGGSIAVTSNQPTGTIFSIDLPLAIATAREATAPAAPPVAARTNLRPKVLVVDDTPENRLVVEALLRRDSVALSFAENGRTGVERFQAEPFDVVLMDLEMPELDGYAAVKLMRQWEQTSGRQPIPIVALTAHGTLEHQQRTREAGFSAHLTKPLRRRDLYSVLGRPPSRITPMNDDSPEVKQLLPGYLARRREELPDLRRRAEAMDFESLRRSGHALKGSGAMYGLAELSRLGAALEEAATQGQIAPIVELLRQMELALG